MNYEPHMLQRKAIQSIGGGLFLMALFTMLWCGIAESELNGRDNYIVLIFFSAFSLTFIIYGVYLFFFAKNLPKVLTETEKLESKRIRKWYGIVFGIEGATIPIVVVILSAFHLDEFIISCIALIVGLHFYPMAKIFRRKIDYYLATWTCVIALIGIIMTIMKDIQLVILSFVGVGVALATTCYGIYMIYTVYKYKRILKKV